MSTPIEAGRFGSGHSVRRIEDPTLVTGRGRYADDETLPGQTHLAFLRSTYAHAQLKSIDVDAARQMPGVLAVFTGADLVAAGVKPLGGPAGFKRPDGSAIAFLWRNGEAPERVLRRRGQTMQSLGYQLDDVLGDAQAVDALEVPGPRRAIGPRKH